MVPPGEEKVESGTKKGGSNPGGYVTLKKKLPPEVLGLHQKRGGPHLCKERRRPAVLEKKGGSRPLTGLEKKERFLRHSKEESQENTTDGKKREGPKLARQNKSRTQKNERPKA